MKEEQVILVDQHDQAIGTAGKMEAHQQGLLHRAFSICIFHIKEDAIDVLLQQRQHDKYHCPGLWSNSCCSHPRPGETILAAGKRRLQEELGIQLTLNPAGTFQYTAHFENGLTENEYDHVLVAFSDKRDIPFNTAEVAAVKWLGLEALEEDLEAQPECYTPWFKQALAMGVLFVKAL